MKRLPYALLAAFLVLIGSWSSAQAVSTFIIPQGGTGTTTAPVGQVLYGGASSYQSAATTTLVAGTNVSFSGGTPIVIGSSPITISATGGSGLTSYDAFTHPSYGGSATTSLLTLSDGIISGAASSTINASNLHLGGLTSGVVGLNGDKVYSAATTTAGTGLTYSIGAFNVNTSQNISTLSNLTSNGFVKTSGGTGALSIDTTAYTPATRALNTTYPIQGGGDLSADRTLTLAFGTTTTNAWSSLQSFANASSTQLSAGSNTFYVNSTGHTQAKDTTNGWSGVLSPTRSFALQTGTTTTWTGSTTGAYIPSIVMPFGGTLRQARCRTDTGTVGTQVKIGGSSVTPGYISASTTVGTISFSAGNTFSAGDAITMVNGTPASSPTSIYCTLDVTETF